MLKKLLLLIFKLNSDLFENFNQNLYRLNIRFSLSQNTFTKFLLTINYRDKNSLNQFKTITKLLKIKHLDVPYKKF